MRIPFRLPLFALPIVIATSGLLPARAQTAPGELVGTIAYTNDEEIRLIAPDGTGDRLVWTVPDTNFSITKIAWRPDGSEIAFASNHSMATSLYERDLFGIRPDGGGLRKLTNPPLLDELDSFPKGTVEVTLQNYSGDGGPFFVYVMGAPQPQQVILNPGAIQTLVFEDVADFGEGVFQHVVAINGIFRWWDAGVAADVVADGSADAGSLEMTSAYEHYGADGPFWRSDGSQIAYFQTAGASGTSTCIIERVPVPPPLGFSADSLFAANLFETPCAAEWSPVQGFEEEVLVTDYTDYVSDGLVHVFRAPEGAEEKGEPVITFDGYVQIYDIRALPDGTGFLLSKHDGLLERGLNLYEYRYADGNLSKLTDFTAEEEGIRSFSLSPDGAHVVYEYVTGEDDAVGDAWIMRRDGADRRLLVQNAASPHWILQSPNVGLEPLDAAGQSEALKVFPNPVVSGATLAYRIDHAQDFTVSVHDVLGRVLSIQFLGWKMPGEHHDLLSLETAAPGAYFIRLRGSAGARLTTSVLVLE